MTALELAALSFADLQRLIDDALDRFATDLLAHLLEECRRRGLSVEIVI
ncbi:hypothetical protein [Sphingomonas morindae]|uniref:IS256 family transposase n=1 Tax=Sphingomonas morindae TaxID=1541170 RepID=A0ABY4X9C0_9SPHN|nr:hypothetical protein [Sphingomonas morindae]USI73528.1 hypothetical protein LHA26_03335 [Sphingomonas morindae]